MGKSFDKKEIETLKKARDIVRKHPANKANLNKARIKEGIKAIKTDFGIK